MRSKITTLATLFVASLALPAAAEMTVEVGGAPMYPSKNIVENAVNSKDHTTLVAAVKAAGLVDTLASAGPFTVFAPTNSAFEKLPAGTVDTLLKAENKEMLAKVLTAHVVAGKMSASDLMRKAQKMGGRYNLQTVSGDNLTVQLKGSKLYVIDESGSAARITIADVKWGDPRDQPRIRPAVTISVSGGRSVPSAGDRPP